MYLLSPVTASPLVAEDAKFYPFYMKAQGFPGYTYSDPSIVEVSSSSSSSSSSNGGGSTSSYRMDEQGAVRGTSASVGIAVYAFAENKFALSMLYPCINLYESGSVVELSVEAVARDGNRLFANLFNFRSFRMMCG
jgi:hypothetical protein